MRRRAARRVPQQGETEPAPPLCRVHHEIQAREWYLTEVIRIALADGSLSEGERQAALAIGMDLGMTQAQVIGVVAMTEQSAGRD